MRLSSWLRNMEPPIFIIITVLTNVRSDRNMFRPWSPKITLEMLAIMNRLTREKERLIEITFDGEISEEELPDFVALEKQLDDMAAVIASLKLWVQTEIGNERIDREKYEQLGI